MRSLRPLRIIGCLILLFLFNLVGFAHSPTVFIPNHGQWEGPFQFKSEFSGLSVFIENSGFTYVLCEAIEYEQEGDNYHIMPDIVNKHAFRMRFNNSKSVVFEGTHEKSGYYNYLIGNNRSKWKGHVPIFEEIFASNIYDGIDLRAYGESASFKYDFIVKPKANPSLISFEYSGADEIQFDDERLLIKTSVGDLYESIPVSYQIIDGIKIEVECRYILSASGFSFEFPHGYNVNYELVIDPVLVAATLSGTTGLASNYGHGATFDFAGNIYTHAVSFNSVYPTNEGAFQELFGGGYTDAVISKLTPDGSDLIFATFLGGDDYEYPISTIVNGNEEIYVFGITESSDFPTSLSAFQPDHGGGDDIFVIGLSADGSELVGSTFLGGAGQDGRNALSFGHDNLRGEINVNLLGEIFIASCSSSEDFPTTNGSFQSAKKAGQDGVVVKLNGELSELIWSTFIGSDVDDMAYGIRFKEDESVLVCGAVGGIQLGNSGEGFVTTPGSFQEAFGGGMSDSFVTHISSDGSSILSSTFLGLDELDKGLFIDLDSDENVWIYMESQSIWSPTSNVWGTGQGNAVIHKLSQDLSSLLITSYLSDESGTFGTPVAFMVDLCDGIYVSAYSVSGPFVVSEDALFTTGGFYLAFYLGVFDPDMSGLIYGTYYTGNHVDGGTSRFDKQGIVYQGVCSCGPFNTTEDAWATTQTSGCDIGVFKIDFEIESVNAVPGAAGQLTGCAPHTVSFDNFSSGEEFTWFFGDGGTSDEFEPEYLYEEAGEYLVSLIVYDPESCNVRDTAYIPITVYSPPILTPEISITQEGFCQELKFTASATVDGAISSVTWTIDGEVVGTDQYIEGQVYKPGNQSIVVVVTDSICEHEFTDIVVFPFYEYLGFELPNQHYLCYYNESLVLDATVPFEEATYQWGPGGSSEPVLVVVAHDNYEVTVGYNGCIEVQSTNVNPGIELPLAYEEVICAGYSNSIGFPNEYGLIEEVNWDHGETGFQIEVSQPGYYSFLAVDIFGCNQIDSLLAFPRDDDPNITIPNIFTPNGDGFNDVFQIDGEDLVSFELQIYNRWGTMVFSTTDFYGTWDGVLEGSDKDSSEDTFLYVLLFRDYCDQETQVKTGSLTVLR